MYPPVGYVRVVAFVAPTLIGSWLLSESQSHASTFSWIETASSGTLKE